MNKLAAVLVVYEKRIEATFTYQSLQELGFNGNLLVVDNSKNPQPAPAHCTYLHLEHNPGVSGAYNRALVWAQQQGCEWLLLLDDDSSLPPEFFTHLHAALQSEYLWIAPRVKDQHGWLSPFYFENGRGKRPGNLSPGAAGKLLPINSGTCIQVAKAQGVGFDEKLPLDFSDIDFFLRLGPAGLVLSTTLTHALSGASKQALKSTINRFVIYCRGARWFGEKHHCKKTMALQIWKRALLLSWRYKNPVFLWSAWKK